MHETPESLCIKRWEIHFVSKPSMAQIARAAGVAPSTLREYFDRYRGIPRANICDSCGFFMH